MSVRDIVIEIVRPLARRLDGLVSRGTLSRGVDDAAKLQSAQVRGLDGADDQVERFQQYGLSSAPLQGAEVVVVNIGGASDHQVIIACDDRRYRLRGLEAGEVALYDDQEQVVILSRDGVEIRTPHEIRLGEGASLGVARAGDAVEIEVLTGEITVQTSDGSITSANAAALTLSGTITSASSRVKAVD